jgi:hypothetical protein
MIGISGRRGDRAYAALATGPAGWPLLLLVRGDCAPGAAATRVSVLRRERGCAGGDPAAARVARVPLLPRRSLRLVANFAARSWYGGSANPYVGHMLR